MKDVKEAWIVEGIMPERALDKLQRAKIRVFQAKKIKKNANTFPYKQKRYRKSFCNLSKYVL